MNAMRVTAGGEEFEMARGPAKKDGWMSLGEGKKG
jgi:hypothetical protein